MKKKIIIALSVVISVIVAYFLITSCIYNHKSAKKFDEEFNNNNFYGRYINGQYNENSVYGYKVAVQISKNSKIKSFKNSGYSVLTSLLNAKYGLKNETDKYSYGDSTLLYFTKDKAIILISPKYSKEEIAYFLTTPKLVFKKLDQNNNWQDTGINSRHIKRADVTNNNDIWGVYIEFDKTGTENFANLTRELVGQKLGIFFAEQLIGAPKITEPIENGVAVINSDNGFTLEQAEQIANALNKRLDLDVLEIKENK